MKVIDHINWAVWGDGKPFFITQSNYNNIGQIGFYPSESYKEASTYGCVIAIFKIKPKP